MQAFCQKKKLIRNLIIMLFVFYSTDLKPMTFRICSSHLIFCRIDGYKKNRNYYSRKYIHIYNAYPYYLVMCVLYILIKGKKSNTAQIYQNGMYHCIMTICCLLAKNLHDIYTCQ